MSIRIGIPRSLAFYVYYPWWKSFFEGIGLEVVVSGPTTKATLDAGVLEAVNDACVPIKIFHGHVVELKDKVDLLFIPRLVSVRKLETETFCPKFLGLPDLLRASISDLPEILEVRVDLAQSRIELFNLCQELGRRFGASFVKVTRAYWKAERAYKRYKKLLNKGFTPLDVLDYFENDKKISIQNPVQEEKLSFAVLGYPYAVYDRFVNLDLIKRLKEQGVRVITVENIPAHKLLKEAKRMKKQLFWHFSNRVIHATSYCLNREKVDGIIHVTAFGCGPDAMVDRMMELAAKKQGAVPFLSISIDEHTGEGAIQTRLEAFVDMLKRRRGLE